MRTLYLGSDHALAVRVAQFLGGKEITPGSFAVLEVFHDADCPKLQVGERCRCEPEFRLADGVV